METEELCLVIDPRDMSIVGAEPRRVVHDRGLPHATVLILPVLGSSEDAVVQKRPQGKSYAGCRDFFGGHACTTNRLTAARLSLQAVCDETVLREANEELRLRGPDGLPFQLNLHDMGQFLRQIDVAGAFPCASPHNVEYSTLYVLRIPDRYTFQAMDDINGQFVSLPWEQLPLPAVIEDFQQYPDRYADGASRVLARLCSEPEILHTVVDAIRDLGRGRPLPQ